MRVRLIAFWIGGQAIAIAHVAVRSVKTSARKKRKIMKNLFIRLAIASWAAFASAGCADIPADGDLKAPSDLLSKGHPFFDPRFVLRQQEDLRGLYCDHVTLVDRQKRGVCRVDSILVPNWRREVTVSKSSTLSDVLKSVGLTNWNGGKQIRVIKKNAILQSEFPRPVGSDPEHWRQFSNTGIEAADLVVICAAD